MATNEELLAFKVKYEKDNGKFNITEIIANKNCGDLFEIKIEGKSKFMFLKDDEYGISNNPTTAYQAWVIKTKGADKLIEKILEDKPMPISFWMVAYSTLTGACDNGVSTFVTKMRHKLGKDTPRVLTYSQVKEMVMGNHRASRFIKAIEKTTDEES